MRCGKYIFLLLFVVAMNAGAEQRKTEQVAPGVAHHSIFKDAGPWMIHVLEVDLKQRSVDLETHKAQKKLAGRENTSVISLAENRPSHWTAGGINGDFFSIEGVPEGTQVSKGKIASNPNRWSVFGITTGRKPFIDILKLNASVIADNGRMRKIDGINSDRLTDNLILYNDFNGYSTGTNRWGVEVGVQLITHHAVNDTMTGVVRRLEDLDGDISIPIDGIVLSGHDDARQFILDNMAIGDTIRLVVVVRGGSDGVKEVIGGTPRVVRDGRVSVEHTLEGLSDKFAYDRHPRTAVGFSRDSTLVYLITVDGRQPGYSVGMSLFELADLMVELGVHQGVNLDGGGSTTMVVGNRIVNQPSDAAGERPVGNVLLVISSAPLEKEISSQKDSAGKGEPEN